MKFGVVVFSIFLSLYSYGYSLGEHRAITNQAFFEIQQCIPQLNLQDSFRKQLVFKNLEEDLNIFRKDLFYSHFFNPFHALKMFRKDSSVRVGRIEVEFLETPSAWALGSAIHHIQDMASPPHVVPVMHGLTDGFESYVGKASIASGISCEQIRQLYNNHQLPDLNALLRTTSVQTLIYLDRLQISALNLRTHKTDTLRSAAFWQQTNESKFGQYGLFGNMFGQARIQNVQYDYQIVDTEYARIKQAQLALATQSTIQAILWSQQKMQ